ncbi:MAG: hypothetical protein ABSC15_18180, partial [Terriglobales bacterium]
SEFFHLTLKPVRYETGSVGIPSVAVVVAYPVRVAVLADENGARSVAFVVAAVVMFHVFIS